MRNSVEGLNQEIERLVLRDLDDRVCIKIYLLKIFLYNTKRF